MRYRPFTLLVIGIISLVMTLPARAAGEATGVIDTGDKVTISYKLTVPEIRFSMEDNVSEYVPGENQLLPGLERELMGMKAGEQKHVELSAEEGFGRYDEQKRVTVSRDQLPHEAKIGDVYHSAHGEPFMVQKMENDQAVIDFNHPLAGKDVVFDVKILKVEDRGPSSSESSAAVGGSGEPTIMTFNSATVEQVDPQSRQMRIRTQEGENWSLQVTRADLLEGLSEGDRVSLELNGDNQVKNVIKQEKR